MIEARIRLAEFMGWESKRYTAYSGPLGSSESGRKWFDPSGKERNAIPDPFTDANDDYAVLKHLREKEYVPGEPKWHDFTKELFKSLMSEGSLMAWPELYAVGDYARAACVALDIELPPSSQDTKS